MAMIRSIETLFVRKRVEALAGRTLNWLWTNRSGFEVAKSDDEEMPWRIKPLAELVFLLTVLRRHGLHSTTRERLTLYALEIATDFDWHQLAAYDPSAATPLALIAKFFIVEDRPLPFEESFFLFLTQIKFFEGMDRLPYREMDYAYSLGLIGIHDYEKTLTRSFSNTAFGREQHLARYTIDDLYSLTHAVFYLTDVGLRPASQFLDHDLACSLKKALVALTVIMMRADNIDVLSELMLCWLLCKIQMNQLNKVIFNQALKRLLASQTPDGAIAPTSTIHGRAKMSHTSFDELYHTTLVAALFSSLLAKIKS